MASRLPEKLQKLFKFTVVSHWVLQTDVGVVMKAITRNNLDILTPVCGGGGKSSEMLGEERGVVSPPPIIV